MNSHDLVVKFMVQFLNPHFFYHFFGILLVTSFIELLFNACLLYIVPDLLMV